MRLSPSTLSDTITKALFTRTQFHLKPHGGRCVTPVVYTAPFETDIETGSFSKRCQKWSVFKTIRVNGEIESIWKRLRILARDWRAREE